ncbi:dihydrofolate reductase [bacterium]|nr:dihydrofolate reductase [bacterium]
MKSNVTIIVAMAKNGVIGKDNQMPWHIPEELESFKQITSSHNIIVGKRTYESIGKLLPNRKNYILTSDRNLVLEGAFVMHSFGEIMFELIAKPQEKFFVIGGKTVFELFLTLAQTLIISEISLEVEGDVFFPEINPKNWKLVKEEVIENQQNIPITQKYYERVYF